VKLIYNVKDRPKFGQLIVFAIQQLLAIMAATLVVPVIINSGVEGAAMSPAAALFGAGIGTLVYVLFTKASSPVFLGSSFAFIGSMTAAFAGGITVGYLGMIVGAIFAGLVYVVIALVIKFVGVGWVNKLMPAVVIGPTVAIIGLSLAGNAVGDLTTSNVEGGSIYVAIICGLITLAVTCLCSTYGKKMTKLIPFVIGILSGYAAASCFYVIGELTGADALKIINYGALIENFKTVSLNSFFAVPDFTFLKAIDNIPNFTLADLGTVAVAYIPVAFVVFAEHIADHKNLSSIIEKDLLEDPGLSRTLLGDGVGSMVGAFFGGCPNTTYGESIGCVAITRNASVASIIAAAIGAAVIAFLSPFVAFVNTIPSCVMGGVCMALYGFIAVSGLKMVQKVDLEKNRNLFVVSVILIAGIGGLTVSFGKVTLTAVACALILGILMNVMLSKEKDEPTED
jgi:uracil permease